MNRWVVIVIPEENEEDEQNARARAKSCEAFSFGGVVDSDVVALEGELKMGESGYVDPCATPAMMTAAAETVVHETPTNTIRATKGRNLTKA